MDQVNMCNGKDYVVTNKPTHHPTLQLPFSSMKLMYVVSLLGVFWTTTLHAALVTTNSAKHQTDNINN